MKYIKKYKIFESLNRCVPDNIREDITDILIELKDDGCEIYYQWCKPYIPKKLSKKAIDCIDKYPYISIKNTNYIGTGIINDYIERLNHYLLEFGFYCYLNKKFDKYIIYIKDSNNIYENFKYNDTQQDIHDIIQELIDEDKIRFGFNGPSQKGNFLRIRTKQADIPLYWDDISDYVLRLIDYLGDRIASVRIRKHPNYREDRLDNINTEPGYIDITIDENTNIDFGLWSIAIKWN